MTGDSYDRDYKNFQKIKIPAYPFCRVITTLEKVAETKIIQASALFVA